MHPNSGWLLFTARLKFDAPSHTSVPRILARLRHHTFFSLGQLNATIAESLIDLNDRPFKKLPGCRRSLFEKIEQHTLLPLPKQRYEYQHVRLARVNIDYHIEYDKHYYSVPHMLVKTQVEVRATSQMVNIYAAGCRVACHLRHTIREDIQRSKSTRPNHTDTRQTGRLNASNNVPVISDRPPFILFELN